jgi:ribosomal protein S18 acetylase RimI-like enzyme
MLSKRPKREVIRCDFHNKQHQQQCLELLQEYMRDPMGGELEPDSDHALRLVQGLKTHPCAFVLFMKEGNVFVGLATYFVNFSTFRAKPYINIHDVIVRKEYRGKGLGRALLDYIIAFAHEQGYCKITLEVREDNIAAQKLYQSLGFEDTHPPMRFWTKTL